MNVPNAAWIEHNCPQMWKNQLWGHYEAQKSSLTLPQYHAPQIFKFMKEYVAKFSDSQQLRPQSPDHPSWMFKYQL